MGRARLIETLLASHEPSVRWKVLVRVLGEDQSSPRITAIQQDVRSCPRVRALLSGRSTDGRVDTGQNVYAKWQGAHWVLATLADLGYPSGDALLAPIGDQVLQFWLRDTYFSEFKADTEAQACKKRGVPVMRGRHRRCASQQGNALHFAMQLGIGQESTEPLVERLLHWQWPDGGWNCDKHPEADTSSFMETLLPMRGLALFGHAKQSAPAVQAALRAAEVFLTRRLFKRRSDGEVIHPKFVQLHYPLYWHYDILTGLKALAEVGLIKDPRCSEALDLLERKELPGGGWPAERRYYKVSSQVELHADYVDWGGTSRTRMNEWVTTDALYVLREAGRL
jgi:hypothetical protein